jgi:ketosteroid isomerase-like protein
MARRDFREVSRQLDEAASATVRPETDSRRADNLRSVQAQIDAIARGDMAAVLERAHPDLELEIFVPPEFPWVRRACGVDAFRAALQQNFDSVVEQTPTIHNIVTQGDTVVLFGRESGVIKATGVRYDMQFVERFTFEDGLLKGVRIVAARADGADGPA